MDRYIRRIAMLSVGAQLGCPVRRRTEGEIEITRPVAVVFETTRSHTTCRPASPACPHTYTPAPPVMRLTLLFEQVPWASDVSMG